jgi:hypothetical protein
MELKRKLEEEKRLIEEEQFKKMAQGVFNEMQNKTFNVDFKKRMELEQTENKKKEEEVNI